jgi:hypothetical protein
LRHRIHIREETICVHFGDEQIGILNDSAEARQIAIQLRHLFAQTLMLRQQRRQIGGCVGAHNLLLCGYDYVDACAMIIARQRG